LAPPGLTRRGGHAVLAGVPDGLGPIARARLGEDPVDVGLDRGVAQEQALGDLGVAQARREKGQHLGLTRGEPVRPWPRAAGLLRCRTSSRTGARTGTGPAPG